MSTAVVWRGRTYASRTEANWAIYFEGIGVQAIHEPFTVQTRTKVYRPDFYLPDLRLVFEVKNGNVKGVDQTMLRDTKKLTGLQILGVDGHPEGLHWFDGSRRWSSDKDQPWDTTDGQEIAWESRRWKLTKASDAQDAERLALLKDQPDWEDYLG